MKWIKLPSGDYVNLHTIQVVSRGGPNGRVVAWGPGDGRNDRLNFDATDSAALLAALEREAATAPAHSRDGEDQEYCCYFSCTGRVVFRLCEKHAISPAEYAKLRAVAEAAREYRRWAVSTFPDHISEWDSRVLKVFDAVAALDHK